MKVKVTGSKILLKKYNRHRTTESGIELPASFGDVSTFSVWDFGNDVEEEIKHLRVGDIVLAHYEDAISFEDYFIIDKDDILGFYED